MWLFIYVLQGPSLIPSGRSTQVAKKHLSNTVLAKSIKVYMDNPTSG